MKQKTNRTSTYPIDQNILHRWSPRAFTNQPITDEQLFTLFEAARWAPSSYNNQPWRFVYAKKNTLHWQPFLDLLVPANKEWAQHAAALIVIASRTTFTYNNKPSITHTFDTGAAWQNLALQAYISGLAAHGMEGFDYKKAAAIIRLPQDHQVHAMCAVGTPGPKELLPPASAKTSTVHPAAPAEASREGRELVEGTARNPLESCVFQGAFHE